jgi:tRNA(Met) C34 N-acetyltransferase TmcA
LDKKLRSTVALFAARGRGKSAALGLSIAGAIAAGYRAFQTLISSCMVDKPTLFPTSFENYLV